jgi:carboxyl-terminal processing protease
MTALPMLNRVRRRARVLTFVGAAGVVLSILIAPAARAVAGYPSIDAPPACGSAAPAANATTSLNTVAEAFACVLDRYPYGPAIDDRMLLRGAMAGMVTYLAKQGLDQTNAILPALTGNREADWRTFARSYAAIAERLPEGPIPAQHGLASAAIAGLVGSLHDNHANYVPPSASNGGKGSTPPTILGIRTSYVASFSRTPRTPNRPPLFILEVGRGTAAAHAGLRPGDIIRAIDGQPPFSGGRANDGVISLLTSGSPVSLTIQRPATGRTMHVRVTPSRFVPSPPVSARVLNGNIAYIRVRQFVPHASDQVLAALHRLNLSQSLAGVVLDLRGNPGGDAAEPARLLGAFVHGATFALYDDEHGHVTRVPADDSVPLLHVPLVALTDGLCASACDATAAAIHDLHLGRLVGERTAGAVSGPASLFYLDDGSGLELPTAFMRGPDGETVDGVGVPPDDFTSLSPAALSAGHDPVIERAVQDVRGMHDPVIDVGGYRLHLHCTGTGSPTVLLDAGAGDDWTVWDRVQPMVARTTRVCSYDRAGNGLSDFGPTPRTSQRMMQELRILLQRAHVPGPYVLVGHSIGGTNMQLYAFTHPTDVGGLVLVDTAKEGTAKLPTAGRKGKRGVTAGGPPGSSTQPAASNRSAGGKEAGASGEEANAAQTDFTEVAAARHTLGSLPLIVLTHAAPLPGFPQKSAANAAQLADAQRQDARIAHLSTNSEQILALRSGHYIQQDQPRVVIEAIREVVEAARHHTLLPQHGQVLRKR